MTSRMKIFILRLAVEIVIYNEISKPSIHITSAQKFNLIYGLHFLVCPI